VRVAQPLLPMGGVDVDIIFDKICSKILSTLNPKKSARAWTAAI